MHSFVYQKSMAYEPSSAMLASIRQTVKELKKIHPELHQCSLADVSLQKEKDAVNVTLFFKAET
ncbi:MAG: hypothetical protein GX331_09545 [Firmicutes bacterium]|nr:hypothetical protein [Bacillota bacterium]